MSVYPAPDLRPPKVDRQYYDVVGKPNLGDPGLLTVDEFRDQSVTQVRGCYGVFDTALPHMRQMGRTYNEVLTHAAAGEFRMISPPVLRWVQSKRYGVRPIVFVQWVELYAATRSQARKKYLNGA